MTPGPPADTYPGLVKVGTCAGLDVCGETDCCTCNYPPHECNGGSAEHTPQYLEDNECTIYAQPEYPWQCENVPFSPHAKHLPANCSISLACENCETAITQEMWGEGLSECPSCSHPFG